MEVDWIPFDAFSNVTFRARGRFATVFTANMQAMDDGGEVYDMTVVLKKIGRRITSQYVNEVCRCVLSLCDG
jgi:hypothetical protein